MPLRGSGGGVFHVFPKTHVFRIITYRYFRILGIETSCDDTAVAVVDSNRRVLSSRRVSDHNAVSSMGGITPLYFANQHRMNINRIVDECAQECNTRLSDFDAVAVSTRPGVVISLKVGIDKSLSLAREYYLKWIPVHHMRAHALVARLFSSDLNFPFLSVLISGGHSLIVLVRSAEQFEIIGQSHSGSPGECLDKIARAVGIEPDGPHFGAALEKFAMRADEDGHLKFPIKLPSVSGTDFNFSHLKSSYLSKLLRSQPVENDLYNFCASVQFSVMSHLCSKIDAAFQFLENSELIAEFGHKHLVVAGGVASNAYFIKCIGKLASKYGFKTIVPPRHLCTDNGEMVAWMGVELLLCSSRDIVHPSVLPDSIYVSGREPIGHSLQQQVPKRVQKKFRAAQLHADAC